MVTVTANVYDGGSAGDDGNLTQRTDYADGMGANDHITAFGYDFQDRLTTTTQYLATTGSASLVTVSTYDNLRQ
jgi:nicotinic acid phosphoribosyltransferase